MSPDLQPTTVETAKQLGLSEEEYNKINDILGRNPNFTELSVYAVMWSEHCSYKNSIKYLKTLPNKGERLLVEAGEENAGLVDIGDGMACAFKIESHNHPSAIEPYQGAATGVGGIHRDIFTMGARPIAALNSLRFGDLKNSHTQHLVEGVVRGIGDYGNCLGVPTVGGEIYFENCYNQNILVNAMSVGVVKVGETVSAIADGPGNPVFIVGSSTGKDGIHGATFASADLTEDSAEDLPAVQVGDPFQEKLLLEASLEVIRTGALVGMQDMGAAGISCSSSEMSAKSGTGMRFDLDKVPTRQADMHAFEILLSESQERMLIVGKKGHEAELKAVFDKWDLTCEQIGEVTDTGYLEFYKDGELVVNVPSESLVLGGGAPVYDRSYSEPDYVKEINAFDINQVSVPEDLKKVAEFLATLPTVASKRWIYEQYDSMVRTNTVNTNEPSDANVVRLKDNDKSLVVTTDCNSAYVFADPYVGAMIAVSEAARNIACTGGKGVAITNCLNFGNPYNEGVYWQFVNAVKGMGDACKKYDTPVTGGNVSFYNQTVQPDGNIPVYPTPTIGMLGILETMDDFMSLSFKNENDVIVMLGSHREDIGQSQYLRQFHGIEKSPVPYFNLEEEELLHNKVRELIHAGICNSAHDVSEGGLWTCLMESGLKNELGFDVRCSEDIRRDAQLFGEAQGRIVISLDANKLNQMEEILGDSINSNVLGVVTNGEICIDKDTWGHINDWKEKYNNAIHKYFEN